jgi:hypothetical protein
MGQRRQRFDRLRCFHISRIMEMMDACQARR